MAEKVTIEEGLDEDLEEYDLYEEDPETREYWWRTQYWPDLWRRLGEEHPQVGVTLCPGCAAKLDGITAMDAEGRLWQPSCLLERMGVRIKHPKSPGRPGLTWEELDGAVALAQAGLAARSPSEVWGHDWSLLFRMIAAVQLVWPGFTNWRRKNPA